MRADVAATTAIGASAAAPTTGGKWNDGECDNSDERAQTLGCVKHDPASLP